MKIYNFFPDGTVYPAYRLASSDTAVIVGEESVRNPLKLTSVLPLDPVKTSPGFNIKG